MDDLDESSHVIKFEVVVNHYEDIHLHVHIKYSVYSQVFNLKRLSERPLAASIGRV
jgi:hypothetical protein